MSRLFADVRLALKSLRRRPGYAAIAIITLALGIGANTAVYSLVRGVLLRPLPYRDPGTLAVLWKGPPSSGETTWLSANEVRAYGQEVRAFAGVDAWIGLSANLTGGGEPERVVASGMTPGLFRTLGVTPALGTGFAAATGGAPEVVISHGLWQRRFGGERDIVGRSVVVNGVARTVVGVLPRDFTLPLEFGESRPSEVFVPVPLDSAGFQGWGNRSFIAVARLAPGATFAQASAQMQAVEAGWMRQGFIQGGRKLGRAAVGAETFVLGDARNVIAILAGAVAMILLIACATVANLTL
ncbi:MAG TPA: ABC transporter permease, partial [Gemmatimonadaceae bacterium]|nr:ABC transporter permease [Gemmatimonadaceae bacterium]